MTAHLYQAAPDERHPGRFEDAHTVGRGPGSGRIVEGAVPAGQLTATPALTGLPAAALMQAARAPLQAGDPGRAGRYQLTARLGSGGMGVVYLGVAEDGRLVAVKILRPELADDPVFRTRFGREAAMLARVRGARVVQVIEAGTDPRTHFLVTEYAAGPTLNRYVDSAGPLNAAMLHELAAGLAEALIVIHAAGVVHRDLKPANVILAPDGPKVIDFGIAQVLDSTALTATGMMVGSTGYMSPEQIMGEAGPPGDIFAWALTVAYAASGRPPFGTGPTEAILYRVVNGEPSLTAVPPSLRPVVEAALAKEPQRRPTADEILSQLTPSPAAPASAHVGDGASAVTVPMRAWQPGEAKAGESVLLKPAAPDARGPGARGPDARGPGARRPGARWRPSRLRMVLADLALCVMVVAVVALALMATRSPKAARTAGDQGASSPPRTLAAAAFELYPGRQDRGVFQTISRIVASGKTIVTTGAQLADGTTLQQFFASSDGGATWRLAADRGPGGGPAPVGYAATRLAGGPAGWLATGPQSIWTSRDGLTWTLAATHGITPQLPGDQVYVLTATASGFLAAGQGPAPGGGIQAVIWTTRDGLTWQRMTAAQAAWAAT